MPYTIPKDRAFPGELSRQEPQDKHRFYGLSKKEYFAGQALIGLLSKGVEPEEAAKKAAESADFLIKELNINSVEA